MKAMNGAPYPAIRCESSPPRRYAGSSLLSGAWPNTYRTIPLNYLGAAGYLTGASNSRKRSGDSPVRTGQPLDDDAKVEDASEK
jgi:hypothetical protein